jgi:serine/threonine protein kinase
MFTCGVSEKCTTLGTSWMIYCITPHHKTGEALGRQSLLSYCTACGDPLEVGEVCPNDGAPAAPITTFKAGDMIDKYVLEEMLGAGGMGEVWKARHNTIQKKVAIKFLSKKASSDAPVALRFKREALAVNQVQHKNIVDIFDFGETSDKRPFFVMEYLQGKDLSQRVLRRKPLPFSEIVTVISQVCRGLQAAHDKGIVHRDLKPENIFLLPEEDGLRVKLFDFGIAKVATEEARMTRANDIFGTPEYMAPEQCEGAKKVDHRADLYSLAVIVFEMIAGAHPFARPGDGPGTIIARQLTLPAPKLTEMITYRRLPEGLEAFIDRSLSKSPDARCSSANEFLQQFLEILGTFRDEISVSRTDGVLAADVSQEIRIPAQTSSGAYFASEPLNAEPLNVAPRHTSTGLTQTRGFLIGAVCVACVIAGVVMLLSPQPQPTPPPKPNVAAVPTPLPPIDSPETKPASQPETKPAEVVSNTTTTVFETEPSGASVYWAKELLCVTPCSFVFSKQEKPAKLSVKLKNHLTKLIEVDTQIDNTLSFKLVKKNSDLILPYK